MDTKAIWAFINDVMGELPTVRRTLTACLTQGFSPESLETIEAYLSSTYKSAEDLELKEIAEICNAIVEEISTTLESERNGIDDRKALDLLAKLEAALLNASLSDENCLLDLDGHFETSHDDPFLTILAEPETIYEAEPTSFDQSESEPELDGFEIDDELLEIFATEAEELLTNMETSLESLANDPDNKDSLWEIRRNAHTFKGSAGIVGLKQLSELAHRVEDLLDRLAEAKSGSNDRIFELLRSSTDCLRALTNGEKSPSLFRQISQLYYDFDGVLARLNEPQPTIAVAITVDESAAELENVIVATEPVVTIPVPEVFISASAPTDKVFATVAEDHSNSRTSHSRSVVRVSLDRLDELVNIVRDMIISRSVFEQRLKDLERQIEDLHNTTRRLQTTSTKLEVDFEASMLDSDRTPIFGTNVYGQIPSFPRQNGFDDLEFDKYTDFHQSTRELAETASDTFAINTALDAMKGSFEVLFDEQRRLVEDLQVKLMRIRMVKFDSLSTRLQRAVRVTCEEENKQAEVSISNEHLEVDTQILDSLVEPLMHLLKNAVVHGIESPDVRSLVGKPERGNIRVAVANEETHIVITISDDGRGIAPAAIRDKAVSMGLISAEKAEELSDEESLELIFLPGLTTAEKVNLSAGRGVGMSIVKESIQAQKGMISIEAVPQKGTTFTVRMPLALATTNVLLVKAANQSYALPLKQIRHIAELNESNLKQNCKTNEFEIGGSTFPIVRLCDHLNGHSAPHESLTGTNVLMVQNADRAYALSVDDVLRTEEVVIKSLGRPLDSIKGILGAAILGNGELVPILDLPVLLKKKAKKKRSEKTVDEKPPISVMIVDDSPSVRHLTSKVIVGAGWNVMTAKDGIDAIEQLNAAPMLPSVILSDIEMPRMDGYEFAASLQRSEKFSPIPIVMITSRSADKHREKAFESGISQYLTKPYDDRELIDTIKILANVT